MGCGTAKWKREEVPDHKFDFIDVRDFRNNGCFQQLKYVFLFIMVVKSFAVYVADVYTAITLLAFGHFSGSLYEKVQNDPDNNFRVPISYGRWIFTGCILFSFLLLAYEAHKSRSIVKSRDISYAYTNVMANNYYSLRSYDHFCFFTQINDSTKKIDELAFFIFFTFKGWKRLLVADGPRQVINFFTLYGLGSLANWSSNPSDYYDGNLMTGLMILSMLFTVAVFAGSLILLIIAALMYVPLLCHIKGNLKEYCCHRIDKRVTELVQRKKKQRLAKVAMIARKEAAGDFTHLMNKKGEMVGRAAPQPTLPKVDVDLLAEEKPGGAGLRRQRSHSIGSSTAVHGNGYYGNQPNYQSPGMGPTHFYGSHAPSTGSVGYNDKIDYASTANLISNAGPAGGDYNVGHHDGVKTMIDHVGPTGTSPMLYAQQVGGNGRASPASAGQYNDFHGQQGVQRSLLDPQSGTVMSSPPFAPQRYVSSPTPYDNDTLSVHQSPFHQPQRVVGQTNNFSQHQNGTYDQPSQDTFHPPPSDMSSYVPYGGHDQTGFYQPTIDVSAPQSSTLHDGSHLAVGRGTDGFGANGQFGSMTPLSGANSSRTSAGNLDDVYEAYLHPSDPSAATNADQRHSYMMSDYQQTDREYVLSDPYHSGHDQGRGYQNGSQWQGNPPGHSAQDREWPDQQDSQQPHSQNFSYPDHNDYQY